MYMDATLSIIFLLRMKENKILTLPLEISYILIVLSLLATARTAPVKIYTEFIVTQ